MEAESNNDFSRLARPKEILFEVKKIGETENKMRMSGIEGGISERNGMGACTWLAVSR
jgi:hypothetical protein